MKNLIVAICTFLIWNSANTQCVNEVSTDPYNATNSALPDVNGFPNYPDVRYLNGFDWINGNADPSTQEYQLTYMNYNLNQPYGNMANIQDANLSGYYHYLNKHNGGGAEINKENGWELMLINLGKYPDDQTTHAHTTLNSVPYLVFYNKYQGVLRVFVQYGYNETATSSINGVKIDLSYDDPNKMSGLLRLGEGVDRSLDQNSKIEKLTSFAPKIAQNSFWMSTDFQLTYDPCVCYHPSNLSLRFSFFTEQEFKLYGRSISVEESLIDNDNIVDNSFLSNVDYTTSTSENGMIIYKNMEGLIDDYIDQMEQYQEKLEAVQQHNAEVEKNIKIARAVSTIIKLGITGAVGSTAVLALQGDLAQFFFNDASDKSKATVGKLFGELEKLLGKQLDTYVNKNFQTQASPTPPSTPTAVFSEMHFDGKLISTTDVLGPTFHTPGSFGNNKYIVDLPIGGNVYGYPVYNNPVGVFALLEKPVVRMSKTRIQSLQHRNNIPMPPVSESPDHDYWIYYYTRNYAYQEWTNEYQYQLVNDLKYTFNQALDIKEYSISAAFVFEPEFKYMPENTSPTVKYSSYVSPIAVNTTSNFDNYLKLLSGPEYNGYDYLGSNQMLGSGNNNPGSNTIIEENLKLVKHTSPFIPVDNFKPLVFSFAQKSSIYREVQELKKQVRIVLYLSQPGFINIFDDPEPIPYQNIESTENFIGLNYKNEKVIKLRLKIDVVYNSLNDQGLNNTGTYIFTYIVDSNDVVVESSQLVPNLVSSNLNIGEFQEDLLLGTTHFGGQQVEGCLLVGSNYTCKAWNNATIEGNLTVANGYTVIVSGANEVNVLPESNISPEIVLEINSAFPFSEPMPEIDPLEVYSFCNGTNPNLPPYMANVGNKSKFLDTNQVITETTIQEPKQPFSFSLFPNPTTQQTTVKVNGEYADHVSIVVYDIAGKEQRVAISGEGGRFNLDVAHLAKGLYLVKVSTFGESQTKQLVIN